MSVLDSQTHVVRRSLHDQDAAFAKSDRVVRAYANEVRRASRDYVYKNIATRPRIQPVLAALSDVMVDAYGRAFPYGNTSGLKYILENFANNFIRSSLDFVMPLIREIVQNSAKQGDKKSVTLRKVTRRMNELGLTPQNDFYIQTQFRTAVSFAFHAGRWHNFQTDSTIWGFRYVSVNDGKTRDTHAKLDGIVKIKTSSFWDKHWPPNGYNCRCFIEPIYSEIAQSRAPRIDISEEFQLNAGEELLL